MVDRTQRFKNSILCNLPKVELYWLIHSYHQAKFVVSGCSGCCRYETSGATSGKVGVMISIPAFLCMETFLCQNTGCVHEHVFFLQTYMDDVAFNASPNIYLVRQTLTF